jgi:hypothetical protein
MKIKGSIQNSNNYGLDPTLSKRKLARVLISYKIFKGKLTSSPLMAIFSSTTLASLHGSSSLVYK